MPQSAPDLFDVNRKSSRPRKPATAPLLLQKLFAIYRDGYERRFSEPPVILKRDGPILAGLVRQFGIEKVEARLRAFLAWDDQYVIDSGFALSMFHASWNRLAARLCAEPAPREMTADRTAAYLRDLRGIRSAAK